MKKKSSLFVLLPVILAAAVTFAPAQNPRPANQNLKIPKQGLPTLPPNISGASYQCFGAACREFGVQGQFFGNAQGTRRLLVNGSPIPISSWSAGSIVGTGPVWDVDHSYAIAIDNGSTVISNTLTKRFLFQWDGALPNHAPAGATVELIGWGGGPAQTDKTVKVGAAAAVVLSWTQTSPAVSENHIRIRIPGLPPGTYPINVFKAGANVTKVPLNFIVD